LTVTLKGERYIDQIGDYEASIEEERFESLLSQFRENNFFSFEEKYYEAYTDLPTTYVYFADAGDEMEIMDYYGAPQSLKDLETELAKLLAELKWTKIED
jgi:hypothetical protein